MVAVRSLFSWELDKYSEHLLRLDANDRRLRFGTPTRDETILSYVAGIQLGDESVFAVFDDELNIIGAAHIIKVNSEMAEVGLSVERSLRGSGVGTALFTKAISWVQNRGIHKLFTQCLAENSWMMRKARKEGMDISIQCGETEAYLPIGTATPISIASEIVEESLGLFDYGVKAQMAFLRP